MEKRQCTSCHITKAINDFHPRYDRPGKFRSVCRDCTSLQRGNERTRAAKRKYNRSEAGRELSRQNKRKNRHKWAGKQYPTTIEQRRKARNATYRKNKFRHNLKTSIRRTLKSGKGGKCLEDVLGYSIQDLRAHLERQFTGKMSWANYGTLWHIDHIVPVSSFTFKSPDDEDFKACWSLSNLRPLLAKQNIEKRDKRTHLI